MTNDENQPADDDPRVQALAEAIFAPNQAAANVEWAEYQRHCVEWCEQEMLRLRAIVCDIAALDPSHESGADGFQECFFCHAQERVEHTVGCLWLRAKQAAGNV